MLLIIGQCVRRLRSSQNRRFLFKCARWSQIDTQSPMGKAMFTIIGAMAELESALISERVKAGMAAAKVRGKRLGRPSTSAHVVARVEAFAGTTTMSIRQIHQALGGRVSRSVVGEIVKRVRHPS